MAVVDFSHLANRLGCLLRRNILWGCPVGVVVPERCVLSRRLFCVPVACLGPGEAVTVLPPHLSALPVPCTQTVPLEMSDGIEIPAQV